MWTECVLLFADIISLYIICRVFTCISLEFVIRVSCCGKDKNAVVILVN